MNQEDVMQVIGAMNDYADKQNNQGVKNIILIALLAIVGTIVAGVIGYGYKEIYALRDQNADLKVKVARMEMKQDVVLKEQSKVMFGMIKAITEVPSPPPPRPPAGADDDDDDDKPEKPKVKILPDEDKRFKDFHNNLEQRIEDRMPPQNMMRQKE